ncbi:DUF2726 domain-containing protein [Halomonas smyrnensis]|uniref:DUF2726 domain-containing protein n=1 Tax=Halomonas smyrnensis TaxID=720605 RepID=UPI0002DEBCE4|nr:DUF2726 domain-containing protein [Halomonas smyrnensis]
MYEAMHDIGGTVVTYVIYGVLLLGALALLQVLFGRQKKRRRRGKDKNYSETLMERGDAYIARSHLMTPTEREVYKVIEKRYGEKYYIFCQVRVVDVIQPNSKKYHSKSKEYLSLFRQLSQWHFDYVLCDKGAFKVFCALELDDSSHNRVDRKKRDRIINEACKTSGLRLERLELNHKDGSVDVVGRG